MKQHNHTLKTLETLKVQGWHCRDGIWQTWWCQQSGFYLLTRRDGSLCLNNKPFESLRKNFPFFLFCPGAIERGEDIDRGQIPNLVTSKLLPVRSCEASWELENSLKTEWSQLATAQPMQMDDGEEGLLNICAALSCFIEVHLAFSGLRSCSLCRANEVSARFYRILALLPRSLWWCDDVKWWVVIFVGSL